MKINTLQLSNQDKADIALKNRLYVSGWILSEILKLIRNDYYKGKEHIELEYENDIPITVVICIPVVNSNTCNEYQYMSFTRKSKRKKGYASKCIRRIKKNINKKLRTFGVVGIDSSKYFWQTNDIRNVRR